MSTMNPRITDWSGKRVWLVGASAGIGAALAKQLSARGARLALSARSMEKLRALNIADALLLCCDATSTAAIASAQEHLQSTWGGVDLVIYLAGDYEPMSVDNFNLARAEKIVEVNYLGAMRLAATVLPGLHAGGGIVLFSSVAGYRGLPRSLAYGPGKAALIHFAECLYFDLAPKHIGVWLVNPGFVATQLTAKNDFKMPALLTSEQAATATLLGLASGRFEIDYPKRFTGVLKLLRLLPYRWYFKAVARFTASN